MGSAHILHVDLDAFYASVEQLLCPELRSRPVLVGGGVVLAASYEARAFGVSAPMGIRQALELCPQAVVVGGSFDRYVELSERVMDICHDVTPLVERISIDEAFLDVSGSIHLLGSAVEIGTTLRRRVREEVGLPISVGIASTKFLAKVASAQAKPDGLLDIDPDSEIEWLHRLPVKVIWGVGPVTDAKLFDRGVETVGQLAATPRQTLVRWLGPGAGSHLHNLAWNRDGRRVTLGGRAGSVGAQSALGRGLDDDAELAKVLLMLADRVSGRMRKKGRAGRTITVRARFPDMTSATRAVTLPAAVSTTAALHHAGLPLLASARVGRQGPVTLVGISVSHLEPGEALQLELPFDDGDPTRAGSPAGAAQRSIDEQIDKARARFGKAAVGRASVLLDENRASVPDGFRELAEKE
ncbi:MAG: DNA polymerase IV [Acidimicrobiia bacterium]